MTVLAGDIADPGAYNRDIKKVVAWARRTTTSSASTGSAVAVLELDSIPLKSGRLYEIRTNALILDSTVNADTIRVTIAHTTDGSTPTASSSVIPGATLDARQADAAWGEGRVLSVLYEAASDLNLGAVLCVARAGGSGSCTIVADGTNFVIDMTINDLGVSPGNTGISL